MAEKTGTAISCLNRTFEISLGEIHVWTIPTCTSPSCFENYKKMLSERELSRLSFFQFDQVKYSYAASQGALRKLLSEYLNILPDKLKIGRKSKGKPYSMDDPGLHFNLSNSGKLAVIAFSRDSELGVDIEELRNLPDLEQMIIKNFTKREQAFINAKPEEKLKRFFRFWTIKESYLKAIGEGMRLLPKDIEFTINQHYTKLFSVKGIAEPEDWSFKDIELPNNYAGTLTYENRESEIKQAIFKLDK